MVIIENDQNQVLEMFISMKFDVESNETTPAIILYRFYEDYEMFTKKDVKSWSSRTQIVELEKKQRQIWNQRPLKLGALILRMRRGAKHSPPRDIT